MKNSYIQVANIIKAVAIILDQTKKYEKRKTGYTGKYYYK
jgi:hypothetical protein